MSFFYIIYIYFFMCFSQLFTAGIFLRLFFGKKTDEIWQKAFFQTQYIVGKTAEFFPKFAF